MQAKFHCTGRGGLGNAQELQIIKFTVNFKDVFKVSKFHGQFKIFFTNKRGCTPCIHARLADAIMAQHSCICNYRAGHMAINLHERTAPLKSRNCHEYMYMYTWQP
jgi:hypothetical protein